MSAGRIPSVNYRSALSFAVLLLAVAACSPSAPSVTPRSSAVGTPAASLTPVPGGTDRPASSGEPSQTDTDWGTIWDALPASFPIYPGSIPTETREGPVSASLAVGASAEEAFGFMQSALQSAGYKTESANGPFEDGSFVINSVSEAPGCAVETRLTPLSGTTQMTVMFGAQCPFE